MSMATAETQHLKLAQAGGTNLGLIISFAYRCALHHSATVPSENAEAQHKHGTVKPYCGCKQRVFQLTNATSCCPKRHCKFCQKSKQKLKNSGTFSRTNLSIAGTRFLKLATLKLDSRTASKNLQIKMRFCKSVSLRR